MVKAFFAWVKKYERHLSALAMVGGFIVDSLFFKQVDLWETHIVFAGYAAICVIAIPLLHWLELRPQGPPRWSILLPIATQFALGGFWSGFVIFYGRSADIGSSWPFLAFLVLVFLGNEYFRQYHARLVFTSTLFFFALYSYAIFTVPILTGTIGAGTFAISTLAAAGLFALFTMLLKKVARRRFMEDIVRIRIGAFIVALVVFVSYFTNVLPPLPLSAEAAGVYHAVWRVPDDYLAHEERQSWSVRYLGLTPTFHVAAGRPLSAYASVFAPTALTTVIVHRWEWYDPQTKKWVLRAQVRYPISGGRDGGYRGYSTVHPRSSGAWRVSVETSDGRRIVRLPFTVVSVPAPVAVETISLQ